MALKLSVCIFTYNHSEFISQTIESVLQQATDFDFEIVIGEDCSTDGTTEIVKQYQARYPDKIRGLYHEKNLGVMRNYAFTITQGRGEYLALMDGDDYWIDPGKLQKQVNFLEANRQYALCFHDAKILKIDGTYDIITCCGPDHKKVIAFTDVVCDTHIPTSSLVFRRSALEDYPPRWFNSLNAPDRPLFLMLTSKGPGYYLNECWSVYRKHPKGHWTSQNFQSQWLTHLKIYKVLNNHTNKIYDQQFCDCERRVNYELAIGLVKHKRFKQAMCYLKRYIRNNKSTGKTLNILPNVLLFYWQYTINKLKASISHA